jgi:prepilin-type N-terminal cleavage/methylation domain-containing protein
MNMQKIISKKNQKGFTLIEIAIVLVIIGLLITGILKGQSMINNARVKNLVNDVDGLRAAALAYQDRYGMFPGDENDPNTPPGDTHDNAAAPNGLFNETDGWEIEDLRLAGLISGTGTDLPTHSYGGTLRIDYINIGGSGNINQIVAVNVPSEVCQEIDSKYDDGVWNAGDIRGNVDYASRTIINYLGWKF